MANSAPTLTRCWAAIFICTVASSCLPVESRVLHKFPLPHGIKAKESFRIVAPPDFPVDPLIIFRTRDGYAKWADVLQVYEDVRIELTITSASGAPFKFRLGGNLSENCGFHPFRRTDGKLEMGWRLIRPKMEAATVELEITSGLGQLLELVSIELHKQH